MPIDIVLSNDEILANAFEVIERELNTGRKFTNEQKDLGIRMSIDALAPDERPWFFEVAQMNKIPLWQTLWGQWRRCQENGAAQAPVLDPGWEGTLTGDYGLEERPCKECGTVFKPTNAGQLYCGNVCGAAVEKRARQAFSGIDIGIVDAIMERPQFTPSVLSPEMTQSFTAPSPAFEYFNKDQSSPSAQLMPDRFKKVDSDQPVDLGTDEVEE